MIAELLTTLTKWLKANLFTSGEFFREICRFSLHHKANNYRVTKNKLAESSPFHLLTNPHVINRFMFGHGVVTYYLHEPFAVSIFTDMDIIA